MKLDYKVIGNRIKELRRNKGLTQEDLALQLDISVAFLSRVERGSAHINLKRLAELAHVLEVPISNILTGSEEESKDYLRKDFSDILEKCTPQQQRLIYNIAELVVQTKVI